MHIAEVYELTLVSAGVSPKHDVPVDKVRVCFLPTRVVGGHQEAVEVLLHRHNWNIWHWLTFTVLAIVFK